MARNQHVVPQCGKWAVRADGRQRASKVVGTQKEAIEVARRIARNQGTDVVIHGRDGKIRDKDSYGNDPFPFSLRPASAVNNRLAGLLGAAARRQGHASVDRQNLPGDPARLVTGEEHGRPGDVPGCPLILDEP